MEKKEKTKNKFTNLIKNALNHSTPLDGDLDYLRLNKIRLSVSSPKDEPPTTRSSSPKDEAMLKNNLINKIKQDSYENHKKERALKILEELTQEGTEVRKKKKIFFNLKILKSEMSDTYTVFFIKKN